MVEYFPVLPEILALLAFYLSAHVNVAVLVAFKVVHVEFPLPFVREPRHTPPVKVLFRFLNERGDKPLPFVLFGGKRDGRFFSSRTDFPVRIFAHRALVKFPSFNFGIDFFAAPAGKALRRERVIAVPARLGNFLPRNLFLLFFHLYLLFIFCLRYYFFVARRYARQSEQASFAPQTATAPRAISSRHSRDFTLRQQDLSAADDFILCEAKIPALLLFQLRQQPLPLLNQLLVRKFGYVLFPLALQQNFYRGNVRRHVLFYNLLFR